MSLLEELQKTKGQWGVCLGRIQSIEARSQHLETVIQSCKLFVEKQPEVVEFLEEFQRHAHSRSVGVYEELLSALVNEVLPGERKIQLSLTTERSLPALEIVSVKEGKAEDIMEGSGGSLVNIISAGLRIIALARSSCAPFLLLDEADCWLAPGRVGQFGAIIGQVARDIGIQVLMISHHDARYFEPYSQLLRLVRRQGAVHVDQISSGAQDEEGLFASDTVTEQVVKLNAFMKERRIVRLELVNFMSHKNSVIPMSETVTCITGENDIGKSAIAAALRSIFYGDSSDSFVHHDAKSFKVSVVLNTGERIEFEHFLKKSPKRHWAWYALGKSAPLMDGTPKHGVPEWLSDVFRVERFEGLDVQLANQKNPVFLLNEPASKRAAILSIGSESHTLQQMIQLNRQKAQEQNVLLKTSESEHASLERKKKSLLPFDSLEEQLAQSVKELAQLESAQAQEILWRQKLERLKSIKTLGQQVVQPFERHRVDVKSVQQWDIFLDRLVKNQRVSLMRLPKPHAALPLSTVLSVPMGAKCRLARTQKVANIHVKPMDMSTVQLKAHQNWVQEKGRFVIVQKRSSIKVELKAPVLNVQMLPVQWSGFERLKSIQTRLGKVVLPQQSPKSIMIQQNAHLEQLLEMGARNRVHHQKVEKAKAQFEQSAQQLNERLQRAYEQLGGKCPLCHQGFEFSKIIGIESTSHHERH